MSESVRKLVSVITPTWGRHDLLLEAIQNVRSQTYRPLEHVIVSDGPDEDLFRKLHDWPTVQLNDVPIRFVELGRRWTLELTDSHSAAAVATAQFLARGDYHATLADDERMAPHHIEMLVDALEEHDVDFVYPRVAYYQWSDPSYAVGIGCSPPVKGAITHALYRRELLDKGKGPYRTHVGRAGDWEMFERWMANGATWHFIDTGHQPTFSHRDDRGAPTELYAAPLPDYAK